MEQLNTPSFLIIGGQRCATTLLWHYCSQHPEIQMAKPVTPEPKLFSTANLNQRMFQAYVNHYFAKLASSIRATGEKSTSYFETPGTARRIASFLPNARILVLLRHPVERAISNYWFSYKNGLETRPIEVALDPANPIPKPPKDVSVNPFHYLKRSLYADLLAEYATAFPRSQIHIDHTVALGQNTSATMQNVYRFLGVDDRFETDAAHSDRSTASMNSSQPPATTISRNLIDQLFEFFEAPNQQLQQSFDVSVARWSEATPYLRQFGYDR